MKTVLVTGATSGIGFAVCRKLAALGYHVLACGRTEEHCAAAKAEILKETPSADVTFFCADLMQQRHVRRLAGEISCHLRQNCGGKLDVLVSNAGTVRSWYATTEEGYEQQFALNHLAGFLLTRELMPFLKEGSRIILTGSRSHKWMKIRWNDIMFQRRYSCLFAYKQSKLCNMLFAAEFNRRFAGHGLRAYVADPGLVDTAAMSFLT
jgi:NAD(P)-dependent dehydrogenase (short-subunit alcohol dehydrogenase family)